MVWTSLSSLLFVHVESTDKDNKEEKFQLLLSLYKSMAFKYNMTVTEFNNFSNLAYEALSEPKPRWTYVDGIDFVLQALTTIGKAEIQHIFWMYYLRNKVEYERPMGGSALGWSCSCFIFAICKYIYNIAMYKARTSKEANTAYVKDYLEDTQELTKDFYDLSRIVNDRKQSDCLWYDVMNIGINF